MLKIAARKLDWKLAISSIREIIFYNVSCIWKDWIIYSNDFFTITILRCHYHWHFVSPFLCSRPPINRIDYARTLPLYSKLISNKSSFAAISESTLTILICQSLLTSTIIDNGRSSSWERIEGWIAIARTIRPLSNRVPRRKAKRLQLRESSLRFRDRSRDPGKRNLPFGGRKRRSRMNVNASSSASYSRNWTNEILDSSSKLSLKNAFSRDDLAKAMTYLGFIWSIDPRIINRDGGNHQDDKNAVKSRN